MSEAEMRLVQELRDLAGVKEGSSFEITRDGVRIRVAYSGGSSSSLVLRTSYDAAAREVTTAAGYRGAPGRLAAIRPMAIRLLPETSIHRTGKEAGIDVEFQTGDVEFDSSVYVDTLTPPEALAQVLGEGARRAIVDLFVLEFSDVVIDDMLREIRATMVSFPSLVRPEPAGARAVDAFARLARAVPRVAALQGEHAAHPLQGANVLLAVVAAVSFFGAIPFYCVVTVGPRCQDELSVSEAATCAGPGVAGVVVGLVVAMIGGVIASRFTRRYRGRSDSSRRGATFAWLVAVIVFSLSASAASLLVAG